MTPKILTVMLNWRRPHNILPILSAIRHQSVKSKIALVECAPKSEFEAPPEALNLADTVFSVSENLGPMTRMMPATMLTGFDYIFFAADDLYPGDRHLEHLLLAANTCHNRFSSIGQNGRNVEKGVLQNNQIRAGDANVEADVVLTSELVQAAYIPYVLDFRDQMIDAFGGEVPHFEDDLFLACGIQMATGFPSIVTTIPSKRESYKAKAMHAPHALCARTNHRELRQKFITQAMSLGWQSVRSR